MFLCEGKLDMIGKGLLRMYNLDPGDLTMLVDRLKAAKEIIATGRLEGNAMLDDAYLLHPAGTVVFDKENATAIRHTRCEYDLNKAFGYPELEHMQSLLIEMPGRVGFTLTLPGDNRRCQNRRDDALLVVEQLLGIVEGWELTPRHDPDGMRPHVEEAVARASALVACHVKDLRARDAECAVLPPSPWSDGVVYEQLRMSAGPVLRKDAAAWACSTMPSMASLLAGISDDRLSYTFRPLGSIGLAKLRDLDPVETMRVLAEAGDWLLEPAAVDYRLRRKRR
jgi:hypothetical protein